MATPVGEKVAQAASNSTGLYAIYEKTTQFAGHAIKHPLETLGTGLNVGLAFAKTVAQAAPGTSFSCGLAGAGAGGASTIYCAKEFWRELRDDIEGTWTATAGWGAAAVASAAFTAANVAVAYSGLNIGLATTKTIAQTAPWTSLGVGLVGTAAGATTTITCAKRFWKELRDDEKGTWRATAGWGTATVVSAAFTALSATAAYSGFQNLWGSSQASTSSSTSNSTNTITTSTNSTLLSNGTRTDNGKMPTEEFKLLNNESTKGTCTDKCTLQTDISALNNGSSNGSTTETPLTSDMSGLNAPDTLATKVDTSPVPASPPSDMSGLNAPDTLTTKVATTPVSTSPPADAPAVQVNLPAKIPVPVANDTDSEFCLPTDQPPVGG